LRGLEVPNILPGTVGAILPALWVLPACRLFDKYLIDRNALLGSS
jgi:hypothetical protein